MCVPKKAVYEEFGNNTVLNGCKELKKDLVQLRYCTCNTSNCNKLSITKQVY